MLRALVIPAAVAAAVMLSDAASAVARDGSSCLQPLDYIRDLKGRDGVDFITRNKVDNLVKEARQLCERGESRLAQMKFSRASELLEATIRID